MLFQSFDASSQLMNDGEIIKAADTSRNMLSNIDLVRRVFNLEYKFYKPMKPKT